MSGLAKYKPELAANAKKMVMPGKGLLACDESTGTVGKRLVRTAIGLSILIVSCTCGSTWAGYLIMLCFALVSDTDCTEFRRNRLAWRTMRRTA
jgi:hypothetical protein